MQKCLVCKKQQMFTNKICKCCKTNMHNDFQKEAEDNYPEYIKKFEDIFIETKTSINYNEKTYAANNDAILKKEFAIRYADKELAKIIEPHEVERKKMWEEEQKRRAEEKIQLQNIEYPYKCVICNKTSMSPHNKVCGRCKTKKQKEFEIEARANFNTLIKEFPEILSRAEYEVCHPAATDIPHYNKKLLEELDRSIDEKFISLYSFMKTSEWCKPYWIEAKKSRNDEITLFLKKIEYINDKAAE